MKHFKIISDDVYEKDFLILKLETLSPEIQKMSESNFVNKIRTEKWINSQDDVKPHDFIIINKTVYNLDMYPIFTGKSDCLNTKTKTKTIEKDDKEINLKYQVTSVNFEQLIENFTYSNEFALNQLYAML